LKGGPGGKGSWLAISRGKMAKLTRIVGKIQAKRKLDRTNVTRRDLPWPPRKTLGKRKTRGTLRKDKVLRVHKKVVTVNNNWGAQAKRLEKTGRFQRGG